MAQLPGGSGRSGSTNRGASGQTYKRTPSGQTYKPRGGTTAIKKQAASSRLKQQTGTGVKYAANSSGSYGAVPAVPAATAGPVPDINAYLGGDTTYQQQIKQFAKALSDFEADAGRRRGILESDYGTSKRALGDQRGLDLKNLEEDYGSRGMIRSGLYGQAVGDYEKEFGERSADLERRQQEALNMLLQEQSQFGQQNTLSQQQAREEALRRRAEQYGV